MVGLRALICAPAFKPSKQDLIIENRISSKMIVTYNICKWILAKHNHETHIS
jgi:hypothetical protein